MIVGSVSYIKNNLNNFWPSSFFVGDRKKLKELNSGSIVTVTVDQVTNHGALCHTDDNIKAFVTNEHMAGKHVHVLFWLWHTCTNNYTCVVLPFVAIHTHVCHGL